MSARLRIIEGVLSGSLLSVVVDESVLESIADRIEEKLAEHEEDRSKLTAGERAALAECAALFGPTNRDLYAVVQTIIRARLRP